MDKDLKPTKVEKVHCPKCGELMLKIYPWSSIRMGEGQPIPNCRKCIQEYRTDVNKFNVSRAKKFGKK